MPHHNTPIGDPAKIQPDTFDSTSHLTERAFALYGAPRCLHPNTTLVQHQHKEFGWFACYQCDECGAITRQTVTPDDLDAAVNAPFLDVAMYMDRTKEEAPEEATMRALAFLGKAAR